MLRRTMHTIHRWMKMYEFLRFHMFAQAHTDRMGYFTSERRTSAAYVCWIQFEAAPFFVLCSSAVMYRSFITSNPSMIPGNVYQIHSLPHYRRRCCCCFLLFLLRCAHFPLCRYSFFFTSPIMLWYLFDMSLRRLIANKLCVRGESSRNFFYAIHRFYCRIDAIERSKIIGIV